MDFNFLVEYPYDELWEIRLNSLSMLCDKKAAQLSVNNVLMTTL